MDMSPTDVARAINLIQDGRSQYYVASVLNVTRSKVQRATSVGDIFKSKKTPQKSQSKASYLASRRDRERIVHDSETGVYKRTMSPNGHAISPEVIIEQQRVNSRETIWPLNRSNKDIVKNNNNTNIFRRISMNEKQKTNLIKDKSDEKIIKKPLALPDVLPVNVKMLGPRPQHQQYNRPTHLSLSPLDDSKKAPKTPPSSPPKSPPRGSPFTPLRTTHLSNVPPITSPITSTPQRISSPGSPKRTSPHIKPSLSPSSPMKISPIRNSPTSPMITPPSSPKTAPSPPLSPVKKDECPKVVEGLQMIQRTEVTLRVNTSTTDASSQTEKEELPPTPLPTRKKLQEEIECEKLSEDFVNHLPTSDRLKDILALFNQFSSKINLQTKRPPFIKQFFIMDFLTVEEKIEMILIYGEAGRNLDDSVNIYAQRFPDKIRSRPDHKKPTDYVYGLFRVDVTSRPRPANSPFRSRSNTPSSSPPPLLVTIPNTTSTSTSTSKLSLSPTIQSSIPSLEPTSPLSGNSIYFTTSEPKAKFLTRFSQDMNQCHIVKDTKDLSQKKEELVNRLDKKLEVLRGEQLEVLEECKINEELGENVESHINRLARPHETAKFRLHIEEVGKITSLLLGLSGRLARAENALMGMVEEHPEKRILESKRDKLQDQLEEAKKLKDCIDRRSVSVSNILYKYLNSEEYADYDHFINMKAKLIMDSKEISDKIKLGEEQLMALKETLIVTD
ncbi:unnamed protein product [Brassicogethes aeneus]|uniref:ASD2 domain-containing protein n=1 Tax=Brassicogethes aeneus TaxID=1431903 RepID=A0A9P0AQ81_BRAAE|nr:unnamed protein product [Brassicogethes aeneus]